MALINALNIETLTQFQRETGRLLRLSGPIFLALFAQTAMSFVDTIMAGTVSPTDLAAVALGGSIWIPVYFLGGGILLATSPLVAHLYGEKAYKNIALLMQQAFWLALIVGVFGGAVLLNAQSFITLVDPEPRLAALTVTYLQGIALGMPALAGFWVLRGLSEGLGRPTAAMVISFLALLTNIPLNYIFIYGKWGLPAMGGAGCGIASALVMWLMFILMAVYTYRFKSYKKYHLFSDFKGPIFQEFLPILSLGVPIGLAIFVEISIFSAVALLITSLGTNVVAGHQIALNYASLIFMIPLSISNATTVRVGQALGRKQHAMARRASVCGIIITVCIALISASIMLFWPQWIVVMYTQDPAVTQIAISLLAIAALFQISDAIQVGAIGALRGYKDTQMPMVITMIAYWLVGLPLGYSLGLTDFWGQSYGAQGFWVGLVAGLTTAALLLTLRLYAIGWRRILTSYA